MLLSLKLIKKNFLDITAEKGLIHKNTLVLADDAPSHKNVKNTSTNAEKIVSQTIAVIVTFSQPDSDIGWDSSHVTSIMGMTYIC